MHFHINVYMCGISGFCLYDVKHDSALWGAEPGTRSGTEPWWPAQPRSQACTLPTLYPPHQHLFPSAEQHTFCHYHSVFKILRRLSIISDSIKPKRSLVYTPFSVHPLLTQHLQHLPSPFDPQGWPPGTSLVVTTGLPCCPACLCTCPSSPAPPGADTWRGHKWFCSLIF